MKLSDFIIIESVKLVSRNKYSKTYYNSELGEFVVKFYNGAGVYQKEADYYTDDREDALGTARQYEKGIDDRLSMMDKLPESDGQADQETSFEIVDTKTGDVVCSRPTLKSASNRANKLDLEYGAVRYTVRRKKPQ